MIGWENNQGAYFIQKLNEEIEKVSDTASDNETNIGKMSDLTTTAKDTLVKAVNEVVSNLANALAIKTDSITDENIDTYLGTAKAGIYSTSTPGAGILFVMASGTRTAQVNVTSSWIFWRTHDGSAWNTWKYVTGTART